jgi:ATP-GRASP peptide maturase of grasp-with-spasm system
MILINSNQSEYNILGVVDWLYFWGKDTFILNRFERTSEKITFESLEINQKITEFNLKHSETGFNVSLNDIDAYLYRNGNLQISLSLPQVNNSSEFFTEYISDYFEHEFQVIQDTVLNSIEKKTKFVNKQDDIFMANKLQNLICAKDVGLKIPATIVTGNKIDILKFHKIHNKIITKAINFSRLSYNNYEYGCATQLMTQEQLDELPHKILPSLFQEYINKLFEIRVFFINGKFYSSAIFSQNNKNTVIDYRDNINGKPNRIVPFKIPPEIESKICSLMSISKINCGSLDIIYTTEKEYVFLEINPMGQFSDMSVYCNYFLEKEIAKHLC